MNKTVKAEELLLRIRIVSDRPLPGYDENVDEVRAEFAELFGAGKEYGGVKILYSEFEIGRRVIDVPEKK